VVSTYRFDWLANTFLLKKVKVWSAAIPNIIADYIVVPEFLNEQVRPGTLVRCFERLAVDTAERRAMLEGYDLVHERMQTPRPPGEAGAAVILDLLATKKAGAKTHRPSSSSPFHQCQYIRGQGHQVMRPLRAAEAFQRSSAMPMTAI
jgi:hypothetical protein